MYAPEYISAVLDALQFDQPSIRCLQTLAASEWNRLIEFCDARQLTLLLESICGDGLPEQFREQIEARRKRYSRRFERLRQDLFTITQAFDSAGLECCLLKGFTHSPLLTPDPITRAQGDIDLWLQSSEIATAKRILVELGYVSAGSAKSRHISPMVRPSAWRWRGDYFDPEMPVAVEAHYEIWSERAERIGISGLQDFWARKVKTSFDGQMCNVLCEADLIGFATLHLLLHLLHGELPIQRAWEIGYFLHTHATNRAFWRSWSSMHSPDLKRLEVIAFWLTRKWFACAWPVELDAEVHSLPSDVRQWLDRFWFSPIENYWQPNKHDAWLHLALVADVQSKTRILIRRLLPFHGRNFDLWRLRHHISTLLPTLLQGFRSCASPGIDASKYTRNGRGQDEDIQARRPVS